MKGLGISAAINHNMRIGISYLTYIDQPVANAPLAKPQRPD
jgi:hypothetical protein